VLMINALGVVGGAYFFPQNDDYEEIPDPQ
jgi:hypothetical protein